MCSFAVCFFLSWFVNSFIGTKRSQLGFQTLFWFLLWFFFFASETPATLLRSALKATNLIVSLKGNHSGPSSLFFLFPKIIRLLLLFFYSPPHFFRCFFFVFIFFGFFRPKKKRVVKVIGSSPEVRQLPLPFLFFSFCCWFWRVCGFYEFSKFYWAFFFLVFRKLFCRRRKNVQQIYKAYYKVINGRDRGKTKQTIFSDEMRAR